MKYTVKMASDGMIYVSSFMMIGSGILVNIKDITSIWQPIVLVLLTWGIYDVGH
jgi:hypothetical protein